MIRTMPNTPMQVGEGCTVYTPGRYVTTQDLEKIHLILNSLGIAQQVPEKMINSVSGLSGCGPAYVRNYSNLGKSLKNPKTSEIIILTRKSIQSKCFSIQ